ncbi:hypothetical protein Tamer19_64010 [Cupriavidus sp. TA19]|uniref:hypothetical protein n=1 Tax=unclassified Cupriavidus TaxID=2640874 RepID=UPI000EBD9E7E|nr:MULTISPECIES: hypothetical protein [unclassified Cupriavidus]BDB27196.1 hypothetical protein CTP10_R46010 [Cupriavidus sp. P-10]GLC96992.1 hypothetical protein Tamer19_64010 [Cupriavidus sp. TA19]
MRLAPAAPTATPHRLLPSLAALVVLVAAVATTATTAAPAATPAPSPQLSGLATLLLGTVRGKPTGMTGVTRLTAGDADRQLRMACQELMRAGPLDLDDTTRFDGCVVRPGKIVEFQLKVSGVDATRDGTREYMASAKPILERGICRNPDVPVLGKLGVTLLYHYTAGRQSLVRLDIAPDQCLGK